MRKEEVLDSAARFKRELSLGIEVGSRLKVAEAEPSNEEKLRMVSHFCSVKNEIEMVVVQIGAKKPDVAAVCAQPSINMSVLSAPLKLDADIVVHRMV